ncbi:MAG: hypothetical protein EPN79_11685 [Burkholderiaceae bacterium]|nr:MAG: hypothetical protein EPN79_11685 [Burkholderiaceae bacterium]TBR76682.1 MAG: hypothetical protein EPN64_05380 [Burkholderiaceae bacterium]
MSCQLSSHATVDVVASELERQGMGNAAELGLALRVANLQAVHARYSASKTLPSLGEDVYSFRPLQPLSPETTLKQIRHFEYQVSSLRDYEKSDLAPMLAKAKLNLSREIISQYFTKEELQAIESKGKRGAVIRAVFLLMTHPHASNGSMAVRAGARWLDLHNRSQAGDCARIASGDHSARLSGFTLTSSAYPKALEQAALMLSMADRPTYEHIDNDFSREIAKACFDDLLQKVMAEAVAISPSSAEFELAPWGLHEADVERVYESPIQAPSPMGSACNF